MGHITVKFLNTEHTIPEDVLTYMELIDFAESVEKQLMAEFLAIIKKRIQNGDVGLIDDADLDVQIKRQVERFISLLCDHGIFTRTVNDYLVDNKGYQYFSKVNKAALEKVKSLLMRRLDSLQEGYTDAIQRAESHVTGMGFSIWSGSFVNHAIYAAMQASTINKQEKEASAAYQREINELCTKLESDYDRETSQYINNEYIPNMEAALTVFAYELLDKYVADLIANGKFDAKTLDFVDIGRSNDLLKNLTLSSNKQAILENAFTTCPYNIAVYMQAIKYDLLDYDSFQTAKVFKQDHRVLSFFRENWGEVSFPTKFNINYHCVNVWASLTNTTPTDLLHGLTEQYTTGIVNAYSRIADMITNKVICRKIIGELGEELILAGDSICVSKAHTYVASIVNATTWEQLTERCGHNDLLSRSKKRFFSVDGLKSKEDFDNFITGQLAASFMEARKGLAEQIVAKHAEQERRAAEQARMQAEKKARRASTIRKATKISAIIVAIVAALAIVISLALLFINNVIIPANKYSDAISLMDNGDWLKARDILESLGNYKNSNDLVQRCNDKILDDTYISAIELMKAGKYVDAIDAFKELNGYKESVNLIEQCETALLDISYDQAVQLMNEGEYAEAINCFEKLNGHKNSEELITSCNNSLLDIAYNEAIELMTAGKFEAAISSFEAIIGHKDSKSKIQECQEKINEDQYNNALQLANQGKYKDAAKVLQKLGDYKDSKELVNKYNFLGCETGDIIVGGTYEQDNNLQNGAETIEWIVLERDGSKALIISRYCIEWLPFNQTFTHITWKNSTIRKWLNETFLNEAFTAEEKSSIIDTQLSNPDDPDDKNSQGNTTDKVFFLSLNEADKYFRNDLARITNGTDYACSKGESASWYWWLRSAGSSEYVAYVSEGEIGYYEEIDRNMGIRPALWLEIGE